ncbi:MAG: hypothetical protein B6D71_00190 [gamma proteobacterium symbiont of Stewartia floridana]|nr:MAG: hypothetical protein B6D71_00190 [gamma proteobacterium symbiont of Stewartia floridana]
MIDLELNGMDSNRGLKIDFFMHYARKFRALTSYKQQGYCFTYDLGLLEIKLKPHQSGTESTPEISQARSQPKFNTHQLI